jgi:hypothetical protein
MASVAAAQYIARIVGAARVDDILLLPHNVYSEVCAVE